VSGDYAVSILRRGVELRGQLLEEIDPVLVASLSLLFAEIVSSVSSRATTGR
jgi:hypothetical protein